METAIGTVTHYYNHLAVAVIALIEDVRAGDIVHFLGHSTDFCQVARSLEVDHCQIPVGKAGTVIALKVIDVVHRGDKVFLAPEATPLEPHEIADRRIDAWER